MCAAFIAKPFETFDSESSESEVTHSSSSVERSKFPFTHTQSGNLRVVPQQVVYQSEKLSIVSADPEKTKINIKKGAMNRTDKNTLDMFKNTVPGGRMPRMQPAGDSQSESMDLVSNQPEDCRGFARLQREVSLKRMGFSLDAEVDWSKIQLPPKTHLHHLLHFMISNYRNPDVLVSIDDHEYRCHLQVLQSYSDFFMENAQSKIELPMDQVSKSAFALMYDWMLETIEDCSRILTRDNILEMFMAAQYLQVKQLEEQCWSFIDNEELFSEENAFKLYLDARRLSNPAIMEIMVPRVQRFFLTLVSSKDFLELTLAEVNIFLQSNYIRINSEMEVFMSAVRWLMADWERRQEHLVEVMGSVRFGLIAPWQLVDIPRNPRNEEFLMVTRDPEVSKMMDDGMAFAITKYYNGSNASEYRKLTEQLGLIEPSPRNWTGEEKQYQSYREFLSDLSKYRKLHLGGRGNGDSKLSKENLCL